MTKVHFINIVIDNVSRDEAEGILYEALKEKRKMYVVTPNVDHIVKMQKNQDLLKAYDNAGLVVADGMPIVKISRLCKAPLKERITGSIIADAALKIASREKYSVFFLGAGPGVAEKAAQNMLAKYPDFNYVGSYSPPFGFEQDQDEIDNIVRIINEAHPDLLIAGMGTPKTEIFLNENMERMNFTVAMSVGAVIDFFAGNVRRCPEWIGKIGMEWFFRFLMEPRRLFKRYFVDDMKFFGIVLRDRKFIYEYEVVKEI